MAEETLVPNPFHFGSPAEGPNFTDRDRELITEAIGSLDFSRLEDSR